MQVTKKYKKEWIAKYKVIIKTMIKEHEASVKLHKSVLKGFKQDLKSLQGAKAI